MSSRSGAVEAEPRPQPALWRAVVSSLKGERVDCTDAPLPRAILLLAVPMALELVMESTFGLVDIFFVGRLGPAAIAAVGLSGSLIILIFTFAMGLSIAATAMVARRIGEGDEEGAATAAAQAILVGVCCSVPVSIGGWLLAPRMLVWMGASPAVADGWRYTAVLFGGSVTIFLIFLNNAIFRGAGDAAMAMRSLWLANIVNMALDPCLIFGLGPFPKLGLTGAAVATTIGRGLGVAFQFWVLVKGKRRVVIRRRLMRPHMPTMRRLLRIALTGSTQFFVATASWLGLMRIVALFGAPALAGYTIALRLIHFAILPAWGLSNAAATLVGQNLGARKPDRAERAVWLTGACNCALLSGLAVLFWIFARPMTLVFSAEPEVVEASVTSLRILSLGYVFFAWSMTFAQGFNGAGDSDTPTLINVGVYWLLQLPLAYALSQFTGLGVKGAFVAVVIAGACWAAIGAALFRRGKWKRARA